MPTKDKEANRRYQRTWYQKNKQVQVDRSRDRRLSLRTEINSYKESNPCVDCGGFFAGVAMDFDHVSDNKVKNVSQLIVSGGRKTVWSEIEKCELVCANCHRVRTQSRRIGALL